MAKRRGRAWRWVLSGLLVLLAGAGWWWGKPYLPVRPAPVAPAEIVWGAPDRPVKVLAWNIHHNEGGIDNVVREIRQIDPDIVLLSEVDDDDIRPLARRLGMDEHLHPRDYHRSSNLAGGWATWGNLILSKHPLYDMESIPNPGGGSFGVWGTSVIDGRRFKVAIVHLSATYKASPSHLIESSNNRHRELTAMRDAWIEAGRPPIVIGGDFNQLPLGDNYYIMSSTWHDVLAGLGQTANTFKEGIIRTRIDYLLTSPEFRAANGAVVMSDVSDHRPIWAEFVPASSTTAAMQQPK